jgi:drug/metabolite transporter (DMT)-like permease
MRKEYVILLLVTLTWGSAHPVGKIVLAEMTPLQLALLRSGLACLAIGAIALATGRLPVLRRLDRVSLALAVFVGLFGFAFTTLFGNLALRVIPASVNALLLNTSPLFIALSAPILLRERLTWKVGLGMACALVGVFLVTVGNSGRLGWENLNLAGVLLSFGGAIAWAVYTMGGRPFMRAFDAISITTLMSLGGTLLLLLIVLTGDGFDEIATASTSAKLLAIYLGVVTTGLGFTLWYYCLKGLPAANVGVFQYLIPVFAVLLSSLLLQEPVTLPLVAGMLFIIGGVRLAQQM